MVTITIGNKAFPLNYLSKNLGGTVGGQITVSKDSGNTYHIAERTDTGKKVGCGIGTSGTRAGIYSWDQKKWLLMEENGILTLDGMDMSGKTFNYDSFGYGNGFTYAGTVYQDALTPTVTKWGKVVQLTGAFKTTKSIDSSLPVLVGSVPNDCYPATTQDFPVFSAAKGLCWFRISNFGTIECIQHGDAGVVIDSNTRLFFNVTYLCK